MADPRGTDFRNSGPNGDPTGRNRVAMIALVVIVLGILAVTFLQRQLHNASAIQDCVAAGRTNCAPISTGPNPGPNTGPNPGPGR